MEVRLHSPAKLNLYLRVGPKKNGFHKIISLMHTIAFFDEITITESEKYSFACSNKAIPSDESNLVNRGVKFFSDYFLDGELPKISILLEKRIPHSAGLGGGSSNAASVIRYLTGLYGKKLDDRALKAIAETCGYDTPFFLSGGFAFVKGFGETVLPVEGSINCNCLVIKPKSGLSTALVYKEYDQLTGSCPDLDYFENHLRDEIISMKKYSYADICNWMANDLQKPALHVSEPLNLIMESIPSEYKNCTMLTGSGSSLFILINPDKTVDNGAIIDSLPKNLIEKTVLTKFITMVNIGSTSFI